MKSAVGLSLLTLSIVLLSYVTNVQSFATTITTSNHQLLFVPLTTTMTTMTLYGSSDDDDNNRRVFLKNTISAGAGLLLLGMNACRADKVLALDMDAFANAQIESDIKNCDPKTDPKCIPKLTEAEALCKYGQSGKARAEACASAKKAGGSVPTKASEGKSLGGAYAM